MSELILLTCPHSKCSIDEERDCDLVALKAATILSRVLHMNGDIILLPSPEYRKDHDMNRKDSRDTKYRKHIKQILEHTTLLIDMHSFPSDKEDVIFYLKDETPPDLVIMTGSLTHHPKLGKVDKKIMKIVQDHGYIVKIVEG